MNQSDVRVHRLIWFAIFFVVLLLANSSSVAAQTDLAVAKSGPSTVAAGTDVSYSLSVTNTGDADVPGPTTLTDTLPANMTFVSADYDATSWLCTTPSPGATGTISCTNPNTISSEAGFVFTFVFHLDSSVQPGTMITNTASITNAVDSNGGNNSRSTTATVGTPPPPPLGAHDVLISEFRLSGPGGASDDYVELYCNRNENCNIGRMSLRTYNLAVPGPDPGDPASPGDVSISFPQGTTIQARQFLLVGDTTQYSLSSYGTLDFNVHTPAMPDFFNDNQGLQLVGADEPTIIDSVGFIGGGNQEQYIEGTGLQPASSRPADQYAYVRKRDTPTGGLPQDTDSNANDFVLVSVTAAAHPGISTLPVLGAPGPKGLTSPVSYNNSQVTASLVQPSADPHASPNLVRVGSVDSGTISIRRSYTNNTGQTLNYLSFRVIGITTTNTPNTVENQAELRLVTSSDAETFENSQSRTVVIRGTVLEYDSLCGGCEPQQPIGGGLNTTVYVNEAVQRELFDTPPSINVSTGLPLSPGDTIDVQFLLNVVHSGLYRFFVYVEAGPTRGAQIIGAPQSHSLRVPDQPPAPRKMINFKREARSGGPVGKRPKSGSPVPTKRFGAPGETTVAPVRVWIPSQIQFSNPKKRSRKRRVRRRSSASLRAKAEARDRETKSEN